MKKVLIITYYFPPAGGPGVQRWLKFVKYLPDFDIQPIVYVPENPTYPILDKDLVSEISNKAIVIKRKIFEPYQLASFFSKSKTNKISSGIISGIKKQTFLEKIFLWIRGNLFVPDARFFWIKPSINYLKKYVLENQIDTIITSGPPHSLHLIGLGLKQQLNINWIADFRDPWTTIGYHKSLKLIKFVAQKHKKLEHKVLNVADTIIVTSPTTKLDFQKITSKPIEVITNGYDLEPINPQILDNKFSIAHIGSLLSDRNPLILWESLRELAEEHSNFADNFELKLIGKISQDVLDTISSFGLTINLNNMGYLTHIESIKEQKKSQILLLIEINSYEARCIIPGKLFEYLVSHRPIIAIGPAESDIESIVVNTNTGIFIRYDEKTRLKNYILGQFNIFLAGKIIVNPVGLQQYSRQFLTQKLSEIINNVSSM